MRAMENRKRERRSALTRFLDRQARSARTVKEASSIKEATSIGRGKNETWIERRIEGKKSFQA